MKTLTVFYPDGCDGCASLFACPWRLVLMVRRAKEPNARVSEQWRKIDDEQDKYSTARALIKWRRGKLVAVDVKLKLASIVARPASAAPHVASFGGWLPFIIGRWGTPLISEAER